MTQGATTGLADRARARLIALAGFLIILLAAGALLLPAVERVSGATMVGILLLAAGTIEMAAGWLRERVRISAMAAGGVTVLAGLLFVVYPIVHFSPVISLVIGWLLVRSIVLAIASRRSKASVRAWMVLSAGTDFALAILLVAGLSVASIIVSLFGPTPELVASFAWVLALSFVVTGVLLLEVASCERAVADDC